MKKKDTLLLATSKRVQGVTTLKTHKTKKEKIYGVDIERTTTKKVQLVRTHENLNIAKTNKAKKRIQIDQKLDKIEMQFLKVAKDARFEEKRQNQRAINAQRKVDRLLRQAKK